jgi:hypothetical protein
MPYHIICMRGWVVRHSKDWPPMSESGQHRSSRPYPTVVCSIPNSGPRWTQLGFGASLQAGAGH